MIESARCSGIGSRPGRAPPAPGSGAGPSVYDHIHVLPRWRSDTNFMTAVADVRVLPQSLQDCWEQLRAAWPAG